MNNREYYTTIAVLAVACLCLVKVYFLECKVDRLQAILAQNVMKTYIMDQDQNAMAQEQEKLIRWVCDE